MRKKKSVRKTKGHLGIIVTMNSEDIHEFLVQEAKKTLRAAGKNPNKFALTTSFESLDQDIQVQCESLIVIASRVKGREGDF